MPLVIAQEARRDRVLALRLDRHPAVGAVLSAELDVEQPEEVIDLRERRDRALASATAGALLDRDRGRNPEDRVNVGPRRALDELARVGVERLEIAPLALGEQDVESERRFSGTRDAGDDREFIARDFDVDGFKVVLAGVVNPDRVADAGLQGHARLRRAKNGGLCKRRLVFAQRLSRVRARVLRDLRRRPGADDRAAGVAAFRPEIHQPIGGADNVEVVLDHDERVSRGDQLAESGEQLRDVVEMQTCRGLVEQE